MGMHNFSEVKPLTNKYDYMISYSYDYRAEKWFKKNPTWIII